MLLVILKVKNISERFTKKFQKTSQKELSVEKVIKRNFDKLCFKWKGYNNSFNNWIDEKRYHYVK